MNTTLKKQLASIDDELNHYTALLLEIYEHKEPKEEVNFLTLHTVDTLFSSHKISKSRQIINYENKINQLEKDKAALLKLANKTETP